MAQNRRKKGPKAPNTPWPMHDLRTETRTVIQEGEVYCGCACAIMCLQGLGITDLPSQDALFEMGGAIKPFRVANLAGVLGEICGERGVTVTWRGGWVDRKQGQPWEEVISRLGMVTPWIASFQIPRKMGHFVIVDALHDRRVEIRDPGNPGTYYWMTLDEFMSVWSTQAVFAVRAR